MGKTKIEWTDETWNPIAGCTLVSPGCTNCYAMRMAARLDAMGQASYKGLTTKVKGKAVWTGRISVNEKLLVEPLTWRKPRMVFVNSMSDLFADGVTDETIDRVFAVMALAPQHTFQVLTKRPERMREYVRARNGMGNAALCGAINDIPAHLGNRRGALEMPLPNVWLGVSVEDQRRANERIPLLLDTPAAVRWISAEPLLAPVDLTGIDTMYFRGGENLHALEGYVRDFMGETTARRPRLDWVVAGGESGPGARPAHPDWFRSLRDQCERAGVAFHFKQWGEWAHAIAANIFVPNTKTAFWVATDGRVLNDHNGPPADGGALPVHRVGKDVAGRVLDGRTHDGAPRPELAPC